MPPNSIACGNTKTDAVQWTAVVSVPLAGSGAEPRLCINGQKLLLSRGLRGSPSGHVADRCAYRVAICFPLPLF